MSNLNQNEGNLDVKDVKNNEHKQKKSKETYVALINRKKKELVDFNAFEVRAALIISLVITLFLLFVDFTDDFSIFRESIKNLIIYILQANIGLLGTILAGLSIILFLFTSKGLEKVTNDKFYLMLTSYVFLTINIVFLVAILSIVYIILDVRKPLINSVLVYAIGFLIIYYIFFILFYLVALINNVVKLFKMDAKIRDRVSNASENKNIEDEIVKIIESYLIKHNYQIEFLDLVTKTNQILESYLIDEKEKHRIFNRVMNYYQHLY